MKGCLNEFLLILGTFIIAGFLLSGCATLANTETTEENETSRGLKEALHIGTGNAVENVSKEGGYYENPYIKILLPKQVKKAEKVIRLAGFGNKIDEFELSMNRAAERAAPKAKELLWHAIKQIRFKDAWKILTGGKNEATLYLRDKTFVKLQSIFKPIIHNTMTEVGATRYYKELEDLVRSIPFSAKIVSFDLDQYVTERSLEGFFHMLAQEEARIREDPVARVTLLLRKVFGQK
jgi:hypothetical protein